MGADTNIFFVIGVAGSGKTLIGDMLARELFVPFFDADDFHSEENKTKMRNGIPLVDDDRYPWLASLNKHAKQYAGSGCVIACSALKEKYRNQLSAGVEEHVQWIFLSGSYEIIYERMEARSNHYMSVQMLKSQFDDLEEPKRAITIDVSLAPETIVENIKQLLK